MGTLSRFYLSPHQTKSLHLPRGGGEEDCIVQIYLANYRIRLAWDGVGWEGKITAKVTKQGQGHIQGHQISCQGHFQAQI